ncbi:hypothetical protein C0991_006402 [Blastosporella zonata]|nr:hypothetical protein C0991_006402 [Blastosporella zonata]
MPSQPIFPVQEQGKSLLPPLRPEYISRNVPRAMDNPNAIPHVVQGHVVYENVKRTVARTNDSVYLQEQRQPRTTALRAKALSSPDMDHPSPALSSASPSTAYVPKPDQLQPSPGRSRMQPSVGPLRTQRALGSSHPPAYISTRQPPVSYDPMTPSSTPSPYGRPVPIPDSHRTPSPLTPVSTDTTPAPPKQKQKKRLHKIDYEHILKYFEEHPTSSRKNLASRFSVSLSTISRALNHKSYWHTTSDTTADSTANDRLSVFPEVEEELRRWVCSWSAQKLAISDASIQDRTKEIAPALNISEATFTASADWVKRFKTRAGIQKGLGDPPSGSKGVSPPPRKDEMEDEDEDPEHDLEQHHQASHYPQAPSALITTGSLPRPRPLKLSTTSTSSSVS